MTEFRDGIFFWKIFKIFRHGIIHHKLIRIDQEHVKENSQESILARWSFMTTSQELAWSYHLIGLTKIIWTPFFVLTWLDRYRLGGMGHESSNFLFFIENYLWISRPNRDLNLRPLSQRVFKLNSDRTHWALYFLCKITENYNIPAPLK